MTKSIICWVLAVLITLGAAFYQRISGPTYPKKVKTEINGKPISFKLPRSHETSSDCEVSIPVDGAAVKGFIYYKRFHTGDPWDTLKMVMKDGNLIASLPKQPAAGKLQYFVVLNDGKKTQRLDGDDQVVIRYKGDVPAWVLIPHILFMFFAMLLSNVAGLMASFRLKRMRLYMFLTIIVLGIGGMILGPLVQKFAFGALWTGAPFGWDLTDNKTLIAFIFWIVAVILNWKKQRPAWIIIAAIATILVFSIPHSMFGSELNYTSGTVTTG